MNQLRVGSLKNKGNIIVLDVFLDIGDAFDTVLLRLEAARGQSLFPILTNLIHEIPTSVLDITSSSFPK